MQERVKIALIVTLLVMFAIFHSVSANISPSDRNAERNKTHFNAKLIPADPVGAASGALLTQNDNLVAENENLKLFLNEVNMVLKVQDRSNGYIWSSGIEQDDMHGLNMKWQRIATSLLVAEYINPAGTINSSPLVHNDARTLVIDFIDNGFRANVEFREAQIELNVYVELSEMGLHVRIPDESIIEHGENVLHKIQIMPFFGASREDRIPGYIFIPDGSGALIRFAKARNYLSSFTRRVYGDDYAIQRPATITPGTFETNNTILQLPVFGVVHGGHQNAFIGIAKSGEAYMEIEASAAGATTDFTWVGAKFVYRSQYSQPTSKLGGGFTALQPKPNIVNAEIVYKFLSGKDADYVGMARLYREELVRSGKLASRVNPLEPPGIRLEVLMAETTRGIISNRVKVMTRVTDVSKWIEHLTDAGITNKKIVLWGFETGGASGHRLESFFIDKGVGSRDELELLSEKVIATGGNLILRKNLGSGHEHQISKAGLARHIDGGLIDEMNASKLLFQRRYFDSTDSMRAFADILNRNPDFMRSIALYDVSSHLYSDYDRNAPISRSNMIDEISNVLNSILQSTELMVLYNPNAYAIPFAEAIFDVPMHTSQYAFQTDTVPFLPIVLSGYVDYFAPFMNLGANTVTDKLRLIDFGAYPSYILTNEYPNRLAETNLNHIYSSRYEDWNPYIIDTYNYISAILTRVRGKSIYRRTVPEDGIVFVEYEGGTTILINYTDNSYSYNGQIVDALSAAVVRE